MFNGEKLKELRKAKGLNQYEFGQAINVTKVSVCCYEKGTRVPMLNTFVDIINFLEIEADVLLIRR